RDARVPSARARSRPRDHARGRGLRDPPLGAAGRVRRAAASARGDRVSARPLTLVCPRCRGSLDPDEPGDRCPACGVDSPERERGAPGCDPHYFETLPQVEQEHFWFLHRREVILDTLRRHVPDLAGRPLLDLGCGSGGLLAYLARQGVPLAAGFDAYVEGLL